MSHRILLVDAEPHILEVMKFAFEQEGFTVMTALTPYEAFAQALDPIPDAVIVGDIKPIPHCSLCLANDLRTLFVGLETPIVMVSTQVLPQDRCCGLAVGADRYLVKPFRPQELVFIVLELIARRESAA